MIDNKQKGFTLIEVIIYIALFSMMIGALTVSAFQLIQNGGKTGARVVTQEEVNFVLKKINWTLTGATDIIVSSPNELVVTNPNISGSDINIKFDDVNDKVMLDDENITTVNVHIDDFNFTHLPAVGSSPEGVRMTLTVDGQTATFSKYLRK